MKKDGHPPRFTVTLRQDGDHNQQTLYVQPPERQTDAELRTADHDP